MERSRGQSQQLSLFEPAPIAAKAAATPERANDWKGVGDLGDLASRISSCRDCSLREGARVVVFGEGDPKARIMLVGEGPGRNEDATGKPFVGRAGQLLDSVLDSTGLRRKDLFITNIVKCRPPANRMPLPGEIEACLPNLRAQMRIVDPKIVVLLGALSSQTLIAPSIRVTKDRGKWFERDGRHYLVTYHPAAVLRDEGGKKPLLLDDFRSLVQMAQKVLKSG